MKLIGKEIFLAPLKQKDCHTLFKTTEYDPNTELDRPVEYTKEKADEWYEEIQKNQHKTHVRLGIFTSENEVVGDVAIQDIDNNNHSATLGLGIAKLSNRRKGIGYEAMLLIIDYAFNKLNINRLSAETSVINSSAINLLLKLNFKHEGVLRQAKYCHTHYYDIHIFGLLKEDIKKA